MKQGMSRGRISCGMSGRTRGWILGDGRRGRVAEEKPAKMKLLKRAAIAMSAVGFMLAAASAAWAVEPRPWLCRDKPVFSSDQPMTYDASLRGRGHWVMIFMRFDPSGGHDGFTVFDTRDVSGQITGPLERGQWYAVGMYREGDHWICAAQAKESRQFVAGIVRDYCYGEAAGTCDVKLTVRESKQGAPHN
jgi:hypothetical protein